MGSAETFLSKTIHLTALVLMPALAGIQRSVMEFPLCTGLLLFTLRVAILELKRCHETGYGRGIVGLLRDKYTIAVLDTKYTGGFDTCQRRYTECRA